MKINNGWMSTERKQLSESLQGADVVLICIVDSLHCRLSDGNIATNTAHIPCCKH